MAARAIFFDASALIKNYADEDGSAQVRDAVRHEPTWYTSPFCFYETLACLKRKLFNVDRDRYLRVCHEVTAVFAARTRDVRDPPFTDYSTLRKVLHLVEVHGIDVSDAYQLLCVREGFFSVMAGDSRTILATADEALGDAADREGIKVWRVLRGPRPA